MDETVKKDILIMETLINNIAKGNVTVVEHKFVRDEILRCSKSGDLPKLKKLFDKYKINEIT
jgi:hypothetical protein